MGIYLNPGNAAFQKAVHSKIYVDKTMLIDYTNEILGTKQGNICVSRPRRFGKSMAVDMLTAYYSIGCDSEELFSSLKIAKTDFYKENMNQHQVIFLNMQRFLSRAGKAENLVSYLEETVLKELRQVYPHEIEKEENLPAALEQIYSCHGTGFVILIDEWDCIFREKRYDVQAQTKYLDFLRDLLKDQPYVDLAYMTGILPIKKYGTHSALNMFEEYTMTDPGVLAEFIGFTEDEVKELCDSHRIDFAEMKRWYDGYSFENDLHIYSPKSVIDALLRGRFSNYWVGTETYEALKIYMDMNFDGLRTAVVTMLGSERYKINPRTFQNDMTSFKSKDDVLTLLVHLGYLAYDADTREVRIPNQEVADDFKNAIESGGWEEIARALQSSDDLLKATWEENEPFVAEAIDQVHMDSVSILAYNNENSLSCVISLAYYSAKQYYSAIRELPTGKGFADIVFLPRKKYADKPALLVELKWDKSASGAIFQIKNNQYMNALQDYQGNLLLVGINYDKSSKKHECKIEKILYRS